MSKKIKQKDNNSHKIKTLEKTAIYTERIKNRVKTQEQKETNEVQYANDTIKESVDFTTRKMTDEMKKQFKKKYEKNKIKLEKTKEHKAKIKKAVETGKKVVSSLKSLQPFIFSGAGLVVIILIIIIMIAGLFGSCMGMFFSNEVEKAENEMTINQAMQSLENEVDEKISEIKEDVRHNTSRIVTRNINWKDILTIYSVVSTNREKDLNIMTIGEKEYKQLNKVFFNVVEIDYEVEKYRVTVYHSDGTKSTKTKRRLLIYVDAMSLEEMIKEYNLKNKEKVQVYEMQKEDYNEMWEVILE